MDWDLFICHASEDKEAFVRPLVRTLLDRRPELRIWYDEFSLVLGDSLRQKIDHGLANSKFGVVVLSPSFFRKRWPQQELDGLVAREGDGKRIILPVWHNISRSDVVKLSPLLGDRLAVQSSDGMEAVTSKILDAIERLRDTTRIVPRGTKLSRRRVIFSTLIISLLASLTYLGLIEFRRSSQSGGMLDPVQATNGATAEPNPAPLGAQPTKASEGLAQKENSQQKVTGKSSQERLEEESPITNKQQEPQRLPNKASLVDVPEVGSGEINIEYRRNLLGIYIGATAYLGATVIGEAIMTKLERGDYLEVEETHYSPSGSGEIIYRARSRFRIQGGHKYHEDQLYGTKVFTLFDSWPMG